MKKLLIALLLMMLTSLTAISFAQEDANLVPSEFYFQTAETGSWSAIDTENGTLSLSGVNPRLQYTMTTPRLWSVALENSSFIETWSLITGIAPLEAILSFGTYNVRLLIESPAFGEAEGSLSYTAQVVEVINFVDETTKEIPASFEAPTLTIQPTLDFTLALMDGANNRLSGTRNADMCVLLYQNVLTTEQRYAEAVQTGSNIEEAERAMNYAKMAYMYACLGQIGGTNRMQAP